MRVNSVQVGDATLTVGDEVELPAVPAHTIRRRDRATGQEVALDIPAVPSRRFTVESFDVGTCGVRCRDEHGSQLVLDAATAVARKVSKS